MTQTEAMEALYELNRLAREGHLRTNPGFVSWPTIDSLLNHISEHGFPSGSVGLHDI